MFFQILLLLILIAFLILRPSHRRTNSKVCLIGKTALITGGNSGIGYETALNLASRGCKVIIADKNVSDSKTKEKIIAETLNRNIFMKFLDLESFESVRKFVNDFIETENRLDILINNAGIGSPALVFTENGLQRTMQTNYFGPFLLTHLLIGLLKKSSPSRIIFTSSIFAFGSNLTVQNLNVNNNTYPKFTIGTGIYGNSKLCNIIAAQIFAEKLKKSNIVCNSVNPGIVNTEIFWNAFKLDWSIWHLVAKLFSCIFGKSAEDGAQTTIHVAISNDLGTGKHFCDCIEASVPSKAKDWKFCWDIWRATEEIVQLRNEEIIEYDLLKVKIRNF